MEGAAGPGWAQSPPPGAVSSLVRLQDARGHVLAATPDERLQFVSPAQGASPAGAAAACRQPGAAVEWVLAAAGTGRYTLRQACSGKYLAAAAGELRLSEQPDSLQLFMDLDRRVVLRLAGKTCLQAGPAGAALVGRLPLGRDRATKLFRLEEAALPPHALSALPLRIALRCKRDGGGYVAAAGSDGALSAAVPALCCAGEFLLAPGEAAPLSAAGGALLAPACTLWTGDGRRLVSCDPGTGQLLLRPQHAAAGRERFTLQLSGSGELSLLAEAAGGGGTPAGGATPVVVRSGGLAACTSAGKPSRLGLELAGGRPTLLLTAHGALLAAARGEGRPRGTLLPSAAGAGAAAPRSAALAAAGWLLEHHGDGVYSLRHAASGRSLFVDDSGAPCLDARGGGLVYPDERLLFWAEPGWVTLEDPPGGGGAEVGGAATDGWVRPPPGSAATAAGFSLRSVRRLGGRHLFLSALPDGLLTTVHAADRPTRWELFTPVDHQALLHSPLDLLGRLPCAPPPVPPQATPPAAAEVARPLLRRAASMQALSGAAGLGTSPPGRRGSRGPLPRAPSLTTVHEGRAEGQQPAAQPQPAASTSTTADPPAAPPRRCQSETSLAELHGAAGARRPQWLAQLLQPSARPQGYGLCSAASLQEIACRQLCAALAARYAEQHGGRGLPPGVVQAVEAELSGLLPEEVTARIARELRLLAEPPPPAQLSLHALSKAVALAGGATEAAAKGLLPAWAVPHLLGVGGNGGEAVPDWQPSEEHLCCACRGASGRLLPLDPYVNPAHHLFLHAMERRARGAGRVRLRARRRHDVEDPWLLALKTGRLALLGWALSRTLLAVFGSPRGAGLRSNAAGARGRA